MKNETCMIFVYRINRVSLDFYLTHVRRKHVDGLDDS